MRLLHSFTKRLLQSDDFLAREGGRDGFGVREEVQEKFDELGRISS